MSAAWLHDPDSIPPGAAAACFYCAQPLSIAPAVVWQGCDAAILLHPDCAAELGRHLLGDAREAELGSGAPHLTRRAARALRAGLLAQEATA